MNKRIISTTNKATIDMMDDNITSKLMATNTITDIKQNVKNLSENVSAITRNITVGKFATKDDHEQITSHVCYVCTTADAVRC